MTRNFGDWTIESVEIIHPCYGRGIRTTAYVKKDDGTKALIREFGFYDGIFTTHKSAIEKTKKYLEA